jgi:hypothetical protein
MSFRTVCKNFDEGENASKGACFERTASMNAATLRDRADFPLGPDFPSRVFRGQKL